MPEVFDGDCAMLKMKRVLLDTNIYEFILKYLEKERIKRFIEKQILVIYGIDIIRKELRKIPSKKVGIAGGDITNIRIALLSLYDFFVGEHQYKITEDILDLADKYFVVYKTLGGFASKSDIITDLSIVACAALHDLDIVVSEDNKTMLSESAINAYKSVNSLEKIKIPKFIGFEEFKNMLRGVNLD